MNQNVQAILLKLVVELKKLRWKVSENWELALKSEGHVEMVRKIHVRGKLGEHEEWDDNIETTINLKLSSQDEITFFPEYIIQAEIFLEGGSFKDVNDKADVDEAFVAKDVSNDAKAKSAATKITRNVENYIEHEYDEYLSHNGDEIMYQKSHGAKADQEDDI